MPEMSGKESGKEVVWKDSGVPSMKISGAQICKTRDSPDFAVGLGDKVYSQGQHELEFAINRYNDGYVYVGVAVPTIHLQQTWCRRCAVDQVWYYFGCGFTNALRNGWDDVVSKEVGGPEMKVPKLQVGDRVKALLDMDTGQLRFSIFKVDEGLWKDIPGMLEGIKTPVVAACCIQERGDSVTLVAPSRAKDEQQTRKKSDRYAHVQSKIVSAIRQITQNNSDNNAEDNLAQRTRPRRAAGWTQRALRSVEDVSRTKPEEEELASSLKVEEGAEKGGGKDGLSVHEEKRARRLNLPFGSSPRNFQRRQNLGADKTTLRLPTINVTVPKNNEGRRDSNGVLLDEGSKDQLFSRDFRRGKSKIATAPDGMKNALSHGPPPVLVKLMQETSRLPMQQLPPLQRSMRGHSAGDEGSLASSVFGNEPVHESHKPLTKSAYIKRTSKINDVPSHRIARGLVPISTNRLDISMHEEIIGWSTSYRKDSIADSSVLMGRGFQEEEGRRGEDNKDGGWKSLDGSHGISTDKIRFIEPISDIVVPSKSNLLHLPSGPGQPPPFATMVF
uniref:B30.2/SPRY domain-containing protein n=1 Tax=Guillardia theta TaxID=55529 RepID=A0A7S4UJD9_GUITH|mmetsp:Transcript_43332/g.136999  ORF Transcript_43332/g.136999 Transcript_43332/m.136999 type:complete len:558 (+) Transcript_43332:84-1757(+)